MVTKVEDQKRKSSRTCWRYFTLNRRVDAPHSCLRQLSRSQARRRTGEAPQALQPIGLYLVRTTTTPPPGKRAGNN